MTESFDEFWQDYLAAHRKRNTKLAHVAAVPLIAAGVVMVTIAGSLVSGLGLIAGGFGLAFASHLIWERNTPSIMKTRNVPYSIAAGLKLFLGILTGRVPLQDE